MTYVAKLNSNWNSIFTLNQLTWHKILKFKLDETHGAKLDSNWILIWNLIGSSPYFTYYYIYIFLYYVCYLIYIYIYIYIYIFLIVGIIWEKKSWYSWDYLSHLIGDFKIIVHIVKSSTIYLFIIGLCTIFLKKILLFFSIVYIY